MRDRELVQRVKDATDLVALVGQAVKLRKQGAAWVGLCPFHSERTPSFQVVQERGFYHCFGCGKHGDAFSWLQEREGLSFPEALEQLAKAAGVELPAMRERSRQEVDLEARLRAVLEMAQAFYERRLADCGKAKDYLQGRAIAPDFAREAGFGYAPEAWEALVEDLRRQGLSPDLVEQSGLAVRNDRGNLRDFLRDRLTIPIHDARGRIIAFGGRAFGDGPKYLNTRETPLFSKGSVLFGFHRAKGHLRDGALVVEGYFDVLQLHQQGVNQAVAPLGTALTEQHLEQIKRFTKRLILCFDGDAAGTRAMEKSLKLALPLGLDVRLLLLPGGEDPDTWCLKLGSEAFQEMVRSAPDWTSFVVDRALEGRDFRRIPDRMAALQELAEYLGFLPNTPERRELFASLAHQLQVPLPELDRAVKSRVGARDGGEAVAPPDPQPPAWRWTSSCAPSWCSAGKRSCAARWPRCPPPGGKGSRGPRCSRWSWMPRVTRITSPRRSWPSCGAWRPPGPPGGTCASRSTPPVSVSSTPTWCANSRPWPASCNPPRFFPSPSFTGSWKSGTTSCSSASGGSGGGCGAGVSSPRDAACTLRSPSYTERSGSREEWASCVPLGTRSPTPNPSEPAPP